MRLQAAHISRETQGGTLLLLYLFVTKRHNQDTSGLRVQQAYPSAGVVVAAGAGVLAGAGVEEVAAPACSTTP